MNHGTGKVHAIFVEHKNLNEMHKGRGEMELRGIFYA